MASERDLELLDQYVSNRLTAQDKTAFEKKLESDTSLKKEYTIQKNVVEKIRDARVKELKTMFNNVPASALETNGTSVVTQVILWVAVVGALGVGGYLYLNDESKVETESLTKQEEATNEVPPTGESQEEAPKQESPAVIAEKDDADESSPNESEKPVESEIPNTEAPVEEAPKKRAPLDIFDPTEETDNAGREDSKANTLRESPSNKSSIVVVTDSNNKKYNFHYQFKEGKLYLFGTFESNLYEIMEFFSDNKRTVFLFYKDSYYLLNEENDQVKPLAPIHDPTLLKKLKDYRGAR